MKSIYDKRGLQTAESQQFGLEIDKAIRPIIKEYLKKEFSVRDLSHEAQTIIKDCELDHLMDIHMEDAKKARVNLERKKLHNEVAKKHGLTKNNWDYEVGWGQPKE